jgi:plastocyanin
LARKPAWILAAALAAIGSPALAADVTVTVTDAGGQPVADAVVTIDAPGPRPAPRHFVINQRNVIFVPEVLVIPVGSTVAFGNLDPFRHHVYSFSEAKKFELKLFGQGEQRSVTFDKAGLVAIGCNIHDQMQGFIHVVESPFAERTDAHGRVTLHALPGGRHALHVWHARLRSPGHQLTMHIDSSSNLTVPVQVKLRAPMPQMTHY